MCLGDTVRLTTDIGECNADATGVGLCARWSAGAATLGEPDRDWLPKAGGCTKTMVSCVQGPLAKRYPLLVRSGAPTWEVWLLERCTVVTVPGMPP